MFASPPPAAAPQIASAKPATDTVGAVVTYGFGGADLGMSLDAWGKLSTRAQSSSCSPPGAPGQIVTCVTDDLPLGATYAARDLRYKFVDGKLVQITFQTSVDGFDYVTAALKRRFGEPTDIKRDTIKLLDGAIFPHVLMTWRNGRSTISLSDPVAKGVMLSVRFALDASVSQPPDVNAAFDARPPGKTSLLGLGRS